MSHLPHVTQKPRETGRALAIAAMALGLVAVLTLVVAWLYAPSGLLVSTFLGIIAVGLGIAALVSQHQPVAASIAGLTAGAITLALSLLITFMGALTSVVPLPLQPDTGQGEHSFDGRTPNNMASGGAVFGEGLRVSETAPFDPAQSPVVDVTGRDAGLVDIVVYVDYSCPYCSLFEQLEGDTLHEALATGMATVEIRPLTFMDRNSGDAYYSSRAAALFACTVDTQPDDAWSVHSMLLHPDVQPEPGPGHTNEDLLNLADIAMGSGSSVGAELAECVTNERLVPYVSGFSEWSARNPVPGAHDPEQFATATPLILVNGHASGFNSQDREALRNHLIAAGVPLA